MNTVPSSIPVEVSLRRAIAGLALPPLLASAFQPFPAIQLSFFERLVFWIGLVCLALCVTWIARKVTQLYFPTSHFSWRDGALVLIILVLFVPPLWLLSYLLITIGGQPPPDVFAVAPYGALFAAGLVLVGGHTGAEPRMQVPAPQQPRLISRLPNGFTGQIYRLTVRDHAVDVVTSEGTFTIRSRFSDAIAEMEPILGHCTHRSHWVADNAISGIERQGGKTFLRLKNGELVPVSRKYKPMLERDGVI